MTTAIPLNNLPAPDAVEDLSYEVIKQQWLDDLIARFPEAENLLPSDPLYKEIEAGSYRELLWRNRANDVLRQSMLAFASGTNLDHLGACFNVFRKKIEKLPETGSDKSSEIEYESDDEFRLRIQLSTETRTTAGSKAQYISHALNAHADVLDAEAQMQSPGTVLVTILSRKNQGLADNALISAVASYLNAEERRPITDFLQVQSSGVVQYQVKAKVHLQRDPDTATVLKTIESNLADYTKSLHRLNTIVALSGIYARLHIAGVSRVELLEPAADIKCSIQQAPFCTAISIEPVYANVVTE